MKTKQIKLSEYGTNFGPRVLGQKILSIVLAELKADPGCKIIFNFESVKFLSTGFSKELFGGLYKFLGNDFKNHIGFERIENRNLVLSSIIRGINSIKK